MFYIKHNSDNFTIIDCRLSDENKERIVREIKHTHLGKGVTRFISTHPDQDHLCGLAYLDENIDIRNFYCVENQVIKEDETDDFNHYCKLRDSAKAFYIERNCTRKWMNLSCEERSTSGINIIWPIVENEHYKQALAEAELGGSPNNVSAVIKYSLENGVKALWMGDLETDFMEKIANEIEWPEVDILFAAHHGRNSGKVPHTILDQLKPKIIVIGEAPSGNLNYYDGYNTITQNSAGDLTFECVAGKVHIYASESSYDVDYLDYESNKISAYYVGTLNL